MLILIVLVPLVDFMSELDLVASDLLYRSSVGFTYEGPQVSSTSWIDHVLCSSSHSAQIIDVFFLRFGTIMSDHLPLCFSLAVEFSHAHSSSSTPRNVSPSLDWAKAPEFDKEQLCSTVADNIPSCLLVFVTPPHLGALVIVVFWTPLLRILLTFFMPLPKGVFNLDQLRLIVSWQGGHQRPKF